MRILITWQRTQELRISSPVVDCSWESAVALQSKSSMAGVMGYSPIEGKDDAGLGRRHTEEFIELLKGKGSARPNPRPMFPNPPGLLRLEPYSEGLRDRIWWGSASNATAAWAAKLGMNLQTSTLKFDETGEPLHIQQAAQIRAFRTAWKEAGHARTPRISVSRSIFALIDDRDRAYFGRGGQEEDKIGFLHETTRAVFGRGYAAEPDVLIEQLRKDEAIRSPISRLGWGAPIEN
jgi:alkanesulfonate monooxygenase SsuD/methylene tetrahydromethanopterin reductase-like flavin-dependent oxidoreductase (luciferase family)